MTTHRKQLPLLSGLVLLAAATMPAVTRAATCIVDPTGSSPYAGTYPSVSAALGAGGCNAPGSEIEVWCPVVGCVVNDVVLSGLSDVTLRSQEATGAGGPVDVVASGGPIALFVGGSGNVKVIGFNRIESVFEAAVVIDSSVTFAGLTSAALPRYTDFHGHRGLVVEGASSVALAGVGFADCTLGLDIDATNSGEPNVTASGVAFLRNGRAADVSGPTAGCAAPIGTSLVIGSDFSTAWLNYMMENVEGIHLHGRAHGVVEHTVFASNLTQFAPGGVNPRLIAVRDASRFDGRNLLFYDNDQFPGLTPAFNGQIPAGLGIIFEHTTCGQSNLQTATLVNNGADLVFQVDGSGLINLDHTVVAGNWGKVLSESAWYVANGNTCPPIGMSAVLFWRNRINADPAVCVPPPPGLRLNRNPKPKVSLATPMTLTDYPLIATAWTDLFLIRRRQPLPTLIPPGLYLGRGWSVDGKKPDVGRLDIGYHNPM